MLSDGYGACRNQKRFIYEQLEGLLTLIWVAYVFTHVSFPLLTQKL